MDNSLEFQQLNSIIRAQARLLTEYIEYSLVETKGQHSNTVNAEYKVQSALKNLKRKLQ